MSDSPVSRQLRTLLVLGRVSNLPTVWSNCLAAWCLAGGVPAPRGTGVPVEAAWGRLALVLLGASCLYVGGMFLNDVFDADFDRRFRPQRPIASGAMDRRSVWRWSVGWLGTGALLLILLGQTTGVIAVDLLVVIILYDLVHKRLTAAPLLLGLCRFLLYLLAASAAPRGITGTAIWCGLALALYVTGISQLARRESTAMAPESWPCLLLVAPIGLAAILNAGGYRTAALLLSLVLGLWILRSLRPAFWSAERELGKTVSLLLAGIVFVDWLAVADLPRQAGLVFIPLFLLALGLQRRVPAT